jgi:predicted hydrocarbon binding protein
LPPRTPLPPVSNPTWLHQTEKNTRLPDETIRGTRQPANRTDAEARPSAPEPSKAARPSEARAAHDLTGKAPRAESGSAAAAARPAPSAPTGSPAARPAPSVANGSSGGRASPEGTFAREREVEASVGLAMLRFVSHRYGERALSGVLAALPQDARSVFSAGLSPGAWISFESMSALVEAIDRKLGRDDLHLVADCGRAVAEGTAERLHEPGKAFPPPELLLAEMPRYLSSLFRGVQCRVRSIGRGYGRIELDELAQPASLTLCVVVLGVLDRTLARFGAREVEVNLLNCRYLGDDENLFDISWLIT